MLWSACFGLRSRARRTKGQPYEALQSKLVADVTRHETELLVEAVCVGAALVGSELDEIAAPRAARLDRPLEHLLPQPGIAPVGGDSNRFDLAAPCAHPGNPWDKRQLQRADHLVAIHDNHQLLIDVGLDGAKRRDVSLVERQTRDFALTC